MHLYARRMGILQYAMRLYPSTIHTVCTLASDFGVNSAPVQMFHLHGSTAGVNGYAPTMITGRRGVLRPDVKLQVHSYTDGSDHVLQVFCKDGCYYALDENALRCYQHMEVSGAISAVEVEVVIDRRK
jgi:hypothetical protein